MYALFPVYPLQCGKCGGDFSVGGARVCFRIPENPCSPRPAVAGRANPLPPVADFGMKEVRTKKKKHMTNDVNGMKKKCGRPALGRTRKLTRGVTVKFSPSATRLSGSGQGSPAGVWRSISGRQHWRPPLRQGIHRRRTHCCAAWREWRTT